MKISRIKHVVITSIIFLIIIGIIVTMYNTQLKAIASNTEELKYRVIAKEDILPGTIITSNNVQIVSIQDVVKVDDLVYRLGQNSENRESVDETEEYNLKVTNREIERSIPKDDRWAIGKIAMSKIYKGELLISSELKLPEEVSNDDERIYSIPFDSLGIGGYNVDVGDMVDICVLYDNNSKTVKEYQNLDANKVIDIVLAKKEIADIKDESGNSKVGNPAIVPGHVCFKLTYDEINKIELAKRQGKIFVGIADTYMNEPKSETFMSGTELPKF